MCILLALLPVTVWLVTEFWRETKLIDITEDGRNKLELYRSNLQGAIKEHEYLPITLASDKRIIDLALDADPETASAVNVYLERLTTDSGASDIYFMDKAGTTIAASNWNSQASFIGRNFSFRPYFQQARMGITGHYFAFGITSNVPGYYISHPVRPDGTTFQGAVIVKTHLEALVQRWARGSESVLVTDENGVVIIASHPEWRFRDLDGLPSRDRPRLIASRKYGDSPLDPMPLISGAWPKGNDLGTLALGVTPRDIGDQSVAPEPNARSARSENAKPEPAKTTYLVTGSTLPTQGWRMYLLTDKSALDKSVISSGLMGGAAHIIFTGLVFIILQRRRAMLEQLEIRDWSQRELERQVRLRTADLMSTNLRLAQEITERSRTEDALRSAQAELVQTSKLAALGQMSAGIAHEINQPLTAIRSYAENALKFIARGNEETAGRNLQRISELTDRMGRITNNLKTFSRRPEQDNHLVDVPKQMQKAIDLVLETGRTGASNISLSHEDDLRPVIAEANQLTQVFTNLISNAADACQNIEDPRIDISIIEREGRIIVKVNDNGHGILPENLPKIFDPFFTTKPFGDGLGLGLSICYGIIRSFGGTIRAENRPNGGSSFVIELRQEDIDENAEENSISTTMAGPDRTFEKYASPVDAHRDQA
ncbi:MULTISPECIES: sensor histidine kinase [Thalassospira]|uniref:histidine kinase n=1 Tax=Thalassospira aquimaris TaxID=3037796 RepID=A0ABT6GAM7_9PROT|nr:MULTISPECIES: ATP-binding protein [Thalassospira]MDG4719140.1 ATP-binding protein [Thalassospira sp. FZY0004]